MLYTHHLLLRHAVTYRSSLISAVASTCLRQHHFAFYSTATPTQLNSTDNHLFLQRSGTRGPAQMSSRRMWTEEEDKKLEQLYKEHGPRYTFFKSLMPHRTVNAISSRCNTLFRQQKTKKGPWLKEELDALEDLTKLSSSNIASIDWHAIQRQLPYPREVNLIKLTWYHSLNPQWNKGRWSTEETNRFVQLVQQVGTDDWCQVSDLLQTRSPRQCLEKYRYQMEPRLKGRFTAQEDQAILAAVAKHGASDFLTIKQAINSQRTPRQISHHYRYSLDPAVDRSPWSEDERRQMYDLVQELGRDMVKIKERMNSRRHTKDMWNQYALIKLRYKSASNNKNTTPI
ncbi:hypothetical protein BC941DRAFT_443190 [Chlamydoabsidia padenii]|nr:hypothetical protein BC941DRAFT_443190 [Chlamydoabsidia padenii]